MPERKVIDISPLLEIMSRDVSMLTALFEDLEGVKWSYYDRDNHLATLRKVRTTLGLKSDSTPSNQEELSEQVGECEKEVLKRTKQIRQDVMGMIEKITKEEITIPGTEEPMNKMEV